MKQVFRKELAEAYRRLDRVCVNVSVFKIILVTTVIICKLLSTLEDSITIANENLKMSLWINLGWNDTEHKLRKKQLIKNVKICPETKKKIKFIVSVYFLAVL
jgi:hypothetical protein